tara:strand:+ start:4448 stop:4570 length:123 start_codon:yes stop_codon:yes gene_type:complete
MGRLWGRLEIREERLEFVGRIVLGSKSRLKCATAGLGGTD